MVVVPDGDHRGGLWVADGYGANLLHLFSSDGEHIVTVDATSSGTRFDTPHALLIATRGGERELYVADRANHRIVVLSMAGEFKRTVGERFLSRPAGLATDGDLLLVADLDGAVNVLDHNDNLVTTIGRASISHDDEWPNDVDAEGNLAGPAYTPATLNSPHGITCDSSSRILISEWSIGGRVIQLQPQ
jgi:hypothetical protein